MPRSTCILCGGRGEALYAGLRDGLFDTPGQWEIRACPGCGLLDLRPRPGAAERAAHYESYFTHERPAVETGPGPAVRGFRAAILTRAYGYANLNGTGPAGVLGRLLARVPAVRRAAGRQVLWLEARPGGRLMDVGCGNGAFVRRMRALGWDACGLDADPAAVRAARGSGDLEVICGSLMETDLPPASFAAVTLHHVVEHLPDPVAGLARCADALAPDGRIIVVTPNAASLGRRFFGADWRGLEVPRHVQVFTPPALRLLLEGSGLTVERLETRAEIAPWIWSESRRLRRRRRGRAERRPGPAVKAAGRLFQAVERTLLGLGRDAGEEIVAVARRTGAEPRRPGGRRS